MLADIAVATIMVDLLPEVTEQNTSAANIRFAVTAHAVDFLQVDLLLPALFCKTAVLDEVSYRIEQERVALQPVPPGTSDLLVIVLDASRHIVMDNPTDIAFINSHTEGYSRADNLYAVIDEIVLRLLPLLRG